MVNPTASKLAFYFFATSTALTFPAIQASQTPIHHNRGLGVAFVA
jgi:hypothetical protein